MPKLIRLSWLAVAAGLLIPMGYPPFYFYFGSLISFLFLLLALQACRNIKQAALLGLLTGLIATAIVYFWMTSFTRWAGWWSNIFYGLAITSQSMCFALFGIIFYLLKKKFSATAALLTAPFVWTLLEYLSTFGIFAQEPMGHSQLLNPLLRSGAPLLGVNYLSFLLVSFNVVFVLFFTDRRKPLGGKIAVTSGMALIMIITFLTYRNQSLARSPSGTAITVALPKPPVDPIQINDPGHQDSIYESYLDAMIALFAQRPNLVIFPESIFPSAVNQLGKPRYQLSNAMREFDGELLLGGPELQKDQSFSGAFLFFNGKIERIYQKELLFPYGEYFPKFSVFRWMRKYLPDKLRRDQFSPGIITTPLLSKVGKLGVTICLESLYGDLVRKRAADGAEILVNLTNDSWFPGGYAAEKHFFIDRMRALENGRYFIQSALYGITGAIDPEGWVLAETGPEKNQNLTVTVYPLRAKTLYTRLGQWRFLILGLMTGAYFLLWKVGDQISYFVLFSSQRNRKNYE